MSSAHSTPSKKSELMSQLVQRTPSISHATDRMESQSKALPAKKSLSMVQMVSLNAIVCGLEFCASAAFCYIPPMLLKAGLGEENMSMVMGVGPLLGFFIVPMIGRASDRCRSRYGRRRPFIFALSILLIFSLIIIPYGELLGIYAFGKGDWSKSIGIALLVVGAVMLDFASQACLTPCEALLSDASRNTDQHERCFTVYSFMISMGGCIGYLITALDWSSSSVGLYFGNQERSTFSMLIILFTFSMVATLSVAQEAPVESANQDPPAIDHAQINKKLDAIHHQLIMEKGHEVSGAEVTVIPANDPGYESGSNHSANDDVNPNDVNKPSLPFLTFLRERTCSIPLTNWTFTTLGGFLQILKIRLMSVLPEPLLVLFKVPFVLKRLALANFCSWTAVMGFNLFFTDFVGQAIYGGNPNADEDSPLRELYDRGVRMGSLGLLLHCICSATYALFVERLVARYGPRFTYFIGMFSFTIAMTGMVFVRNIYLVNTMAAMTGIAYATVTTIPFMLVTEYHEGKELYFYDTRDVEGATPVRGIGTDMATLDSAYFGSQVVLSALMGYVVHMTGTVLAYIVCAGSFGAVACASVTRIVYSRQQMRNFIKREKVKPMSAVEAL